MIFPSFKNALIILDIVLAIIGIILMFKAYSRHDPKILLFSYIDTSVFCVITWILTIWTGINKSFTAVIAIICIFNTFLTLVCCEEIIRLWPRKKGIKHRNGRE